MKTIKVIMLVLNVLLFTACNAQIKNQKTETVKVYGNCNMCKSTIEKAGKKKKEAKVEWNEDTKMATISYDSLKTTSSEILKRIALSGYDNELFIAPDDAYANLPNCCQYERKVQNIVKTDEPKMDMKEDNSGHDHNAMTDTKQEEPQLKAVFNTYFAVKDALVKTDGNTASAKAKDLTSAINAVKMEKLNHEEHMVWMKVLESLKEDAEHIADTKDTAHQRDHFLTLSKNMYALIKVSKTETPTYYQFCPMANNGKGANWLSKESDIKNPYYGSQMLNCGKTVENLK